MPKESGLGDQLFIDGFDIGADINSIGGIATPRETLPATGITQFAMARFFGKRDATAEFVSFFNDSTGQAHEALSGLPRTDVQVMYLRGAGLGNEAFGMVAKQIDYAPTRGDDGALTFAVSAQSNSFGGDWSTQLTAGKVTHASATSTTGVDSGAASTFGFQAYLQVFSIGSGTASIDIEESSDDGAVDTYASIASFTDVTARGTERIQTSSTQAVEQFLRVTTSGTFTDLVFAVIVNRNLAARVI